MRFEDLQIGDQFKIDGKPYEAAIKGERIVVAYVLGLNSPRHPKAVSGKDFFVRQPDPNDLAGDQFLTTAFSDLRFNANNLTDFERECDEELAALL